MRVLFISLADAYDQSSTVIHYLREQLKASGHESHLLAYRKYTKDTQVISLHEGEKTWYHTPAGQPTKTGLTDLYSPTLLSIIEHPLFNDCDIVHIHSVMGGYFSYLLLPFLSTKSLVWTIDNSYPITGGCLHGEKCVRWRHHGCSDCPLDKGKEIKPDRALLQETKANIFNLLDCHVVTNSAILKTQAQSSVFKKQKIHHINYGVDPTLFATGQQEAARRQLNLPKNKKIILYNAPGGVSNIMNGGKTLVLALSQLPDQLHGICLLILGSENNTMFNQLPIEVKSIPQPLHPHQRALCYEAADVVVCPSLPDFSTMTILEAGASAKPIVAFQSAAVNEILQHNKSGYLAKNSDSQDLAQGIGRCLTDSAYADSLGNEVRRKVSGQYTAKTMASCYLDLYSQLTGKQTETGKKTMPVISDPASPHQELYAKYDIRIAPSVQAMDWATVWQDFEADYNKYGTEQEKERGIYTDLFMICVLENIPADSMSDQGDLLITVMEKWMIHRKCPPRCGHLKDKEKMVNINFALLMRDRLTKYLLSTPYAKFAAIDQIKQSRMINFWRAVFLNHSSSLHLTKEPVDRVTSPASPLYPDVLIQSMYNPSPNAGISVDLEKLMFSNAPIAIKVILAFWLTNVPYFNGNDEMRRIALKNLHTFSSAAAKHTALIPAGLFHACTEHFTQSFWRASYLGGNHIQELSAYGDFIHAKMKQLYPDLAKLKFRKRRKKTGKIRIGYISSNFCNQAVSYYMVNRFLHHDKEKFEIVTFQIQKRTDEMTKRIEEHSDKFITITDFNDIGAIAKQIMDSSLDILIYADIGMDQVTYKLGAMQLAPVQCVLVGHGTTTGLPTIQYYISGDFEPVNGDEHYREKLVRLPNLGAAQYAPFIPNEKITRSYFNLPEDKVIFVSCANGIKHGPERDKLLIDILRQAENAVIVLKPFMANPLVEDRFVNRIKTAANEAGVGERLILLPPLPKPSDLLALLAVSDVQLDTYPYGGWTTNLEALYVGLPIVTQEGEMARNRWGAAMLRVLGIKEGIATNEQEYVEWAVRFANDDSLRMKLRHHINNSVKDKLFNGQKAQVDYEEFLAAIYK